MVALRVIAESYIVCNVTQAAPPRTDARELELDFVAEHLPSRAAVLVRLLVRQVRNTEVSRTELQVLALLDEAPRRITELTELEGTAQPTMTLLVKRVEEKGWVRRDGLPSDGRVTIISLSAAGRTAYARFRAQFLAAMRADLEHVSDERLHALAGATETLGALVDELQRRA
jgi:DNA-binding MarR family transcriptional regulator